MEIIKQDLNRQLSVIETDSVLLERLSADEISDIRRKNESALLSKTKKTLLKFCNDNAIDTLAFINNDVLNTTADYLRQQDSSKHLTHGKSRYLKDPLGDIKTSDQRQFLSIIRSRTQDLKNLYEAPFKKYVKTLKKSHEKRVPTDQEDMLFKPHEDRVFYRIKNLEISHTQNTIKDILNSNGFELFDYTKGLAVKTKHHPTYKKGEEKNPQKIGRILNSLPDYDDPQSPLTMKAILKQFDDDASRHALIMAVSRKTEDIYTMSTNRGWQNCMTAGKENWRKVPVAIKQGSLVAYLIKNNDLDITDPLARVTLHSYRSEKVKSQSHLAKRQFEEASYCDFWAEPFITSIHVGLGLATYIPSAAIRNFASATGIYKKPEITHTINFPQHKTYGINQESLTKASLTLAQKIHALWENHLVQKPTKTFGLKPWLYSDGQLNVNMKNFKL